MGFLDQRDYHRSFINSPAWKRFRIKILSERGAICERCGEHGTDIHHKTYARFGGMERPQDVEVLCRECHDVHHSMEKTVYKRKKRKRSRKPAMTGIAIVRKYSQAKLTAVAQAMGTSYLALRCGLLVQDVDMLRDAAEKLGINPILPKRIAKNKPSHNRSKKKKKGQLTKAELIAINHGPK